MNYTCGCHIHVGTWEPVTSLPHICMCELVALLRGCYSHARACSPAACGSYATYIYLYIFMYKGTLTYIYSNHDAGLQARAVA